MGMVPLPSRDWRVEATHLLEELQSHWLEVCKIESRHGGYIRVPVSVNAEWYRRFCRKYQSSRHKYPKLRTIIRRETTINALRRIMRGDLSGVYAERLMPFLTEVRLLQQLAERLPRRKASILEEVPF